jgi:5-methylcytosine-specific restriction endonuclease McrA
MDKKLLKPRKDRTGETYGKLTVLSFSKYVGDSILKTRTSLWLCECECGNKIEVRNSNLTSLSTKSCGCLLKEHNKKLAISRVSDKSSFNHLYNEYKRNAIKYGRVFKLTEEEFKILTSNNCHYCGIPPSKEIISNGSKIFKGGGYKYNGIDRFNNELGYELDNSVTCCWKCNNAKKDMHISDFKDWIKQIHSFYINKSFE